jgi:hypothetical protein
MRVEFEADELLTSFGSRSAALTLRHLVKRNPAKRTRRGTLVAAFRYCLPAASRTASLALPTPLRM